MSRQLIAILLILLFILTLSPMGALAQDGVGGAPGAQPIQVEYQTVNPSDGFNYGLKRVREKISLTFLFYSKQKKADYYKELVNRRIAELKFVVDKKDMANFENATTRYFTTVGQFVDFLVKNGSTDQKSQAIKNLSSHIPVLEGLRDTFEGQEKAEWRFMQDDINYVKMYTDQLQK